MIGAARQTERTAPLDFQGGSLSSATAFDTRTVIDGTQTISTRLTFRGGDTLQGETTFQVSNPPVSSTVAINPGGSKATLGGVVWLADTYFIGGKTTSNSAVTDVLGATGGSPWEQGNGCSPRTPRAAIRSWSISTFIRR